MTIKDLLTLSVRNLWRRKLRTALTVLGVVIGTASIVLMMSLGLAIQRESEQMIDSLGGLTTVEVMGADGGHFDMYGGGGNNAGAKKLNDQMVKQFDNIPHVTATLPKMRLNAQLMFGRYQTDNWPELLGVDPKRLEPFGIELVSGRMFTPQDKYGIIAGPLTFAQYNYNTGAMKEIPFDREKDQDKLIIRLGWEDPSAAFLGGQKTSKDYKIKLLGEVKTANPWMSVVYMNIDTVKAFNQEVMKLESYGDESNLKSRMRQRDTTYDTVSVKVDALEHVEEVQSQIQEMGFQTHSMLEMNESMQQQMGQIQAVLGGIGAVSLLVAAIGITNTMVMSIYERTKEIGVMKVIGASVASIRNIFLTEAVLIGFLGGVFGILLSLGGSKLLNFLYQGSGASEFSGGVGMISYIPPWLVIVAVTFAGVIGLASGYLPAIRATKLSAIEAIRTNG